MTSARPLRILMTGAGGQVGAPALRLLSAAGHHVVALTHRTEVPGAADSVRGDITLPSFGLPARQYRHLLRQTDTVVHCAAETGFGPDARRTLDVNVRGTGHVIGFAVQAHARLVHLSSAFVARAGTVRRNAAAYAGDSAAPITTYLDSKQRAEELVRGAGASVVVVRPSLVVGDSQSGHVDRVQGLLSALVALGSGWLAQMPGRPGTRLDMVPSDYVARTVLAAATGADVPEDVWATAGPEALTMARLVDLMGAGAPRGVELVSPDACFRMARLHRTTRTELLRQMAAQFTALDATDTLPSPTTEALGVSPPTAELIETTWVRMAAHLVERYPTVGPSPRSRLRTQ
ncbi:SDR family oxidoreductase [Streptomyces aureocirculatus]|uniref:SDR family oxidoreductase n=1 Tax=Streptomyces aureocirculatus TaxID=67275 RepID=UPI00068D1408|nr:SDR family oxidoreductase [Streptomyces aureocirculatus]